MKPGEVVLETTLDGEPLIIRYPKMEDVESMVAYRNKISAEQIYIGSQGEQFTVDELGKSLKTILEKVEQGNAVILVVIKNGKVVGIADTGRYKTGAMTHMGDLGLTLDSSIRGKGVGNKLLEALLNEAVKNMKDLKIIRLEMFAVNEPALKLYKKFGFVEYGRLPEGFKRKGEYYEHISMYKKL